MFASITNRHFQRFNVSGTPGNNDHLGIGR